MELSWNVLSSSEQEIVQEAFCQAAREEALRYRSAGLVGELKALRCALRGLSLEARSLLLTEEELSVMYEGGRLRRSRLDEVETRVVEQLEWLTIPERGRPTLLARRAGIAALRKIWLSRGGDPAPGRLEADTTELNAFRPNAFTRFLGDCLMRLDKSLRDREVACRAAHSALLASGKIGRE
jgi:hypothetical protein